MSNMISFIFVNRGGLNLIDAINNVKRVYAGIDKEIIVIEQFDSLPFMRGQLFNIGVKYSKGEYIALSDNDIYHLRYVPWIDIYKLENAPLIGWKYISQVTLTNGEAKITSTSEIKTGFGAFNFMQKNDFIQFNGFSNLFIGYGAEDKFYVKRFNYIRVPLNLGHITHPSHRNVNPKNLQYNIELAKNYIDKIDKRYDGIEQTTFVEISKDIIDSVTYIKVKDISVPDSYLYIDLLNKHYELLGTL